MSFIAWYLSLTSTGMVRDFSHRKVKISPRTVNPPIDYHKPAPAQCDFKVQGPKKGLPAWGIFPPKTQTCRFFGNCVIGTGS
jgi:hypothetical protein